MSGSDIRIRVFGMLSANFTGTQKVTGRKHKVLVILFA